MVYASLYTSGHSQILLQKTLHTNQSRIAKELEHSPRFKTK